MAEVAAKASATKWAIIVLAAPVVVNLILMMIRTPSGFGSFFGSYLLWTVLIPVLSFVGLIFIVDTIASKMYHAKSDFWGIFRVMGYASIVFWISVLPWLLGGVLDVFRFYNLIVLLAGIWNLLVAYHMLLEHYKLKQQDVVITLVLSIVGYFIVNYILGSVLIGVGYRAF